MVKVLGIVHNFWCAEVHPIVEVPEEEEVVELVSQVKLGQLLLLEVAHPLQDVVVVLVASGMGKVCSTTPLC